jgi:CubicO group peptidase (beta-lactamase class C family)
MMATEVDDGLFTWDTPVISLYPSFAVADPDLTRQITMRHLVCACSGVPRRDLEFLFNASELTPEDVIASLRDFAFYTGFGETFQYSNQMVAAAGYIAAAVASGTSEDLLARYADQLRERVLEPAGMTRTTLDFDLVRSDPSAATPHGMTLDGDYVPLSLDMEATLLPVAPAGAHWSTANDMARYLITEIQQGVAPGGQRVVSEANLLETWKPQVAVDAETSYGLGWLVGSYKGVKMIFHGGATLGFSSDLAFLPDVGLGIVVLANGQGANLLTEGLRYRLLELVYDQPAEFDEILRYAEEQGANAQAEIRANLADTVDVATVRPYLGQYVNQALGEITLSLEGDALILDAGEFRTALRQLKAVPAGGFGFLAADPPLTGLAVDLRRSPAGQPMVVIRSPSGFEEYAFEVAGAPLATPLATSLAGS